MIVSPKCRTELRVIFVSVAFFLLADSIVFAETPKEMTVEQAYPGLTSGTLKDAKMVKLKKGILVVSEDLEVEESKILEAVANADPKTRDELRKSQFFLLEQETVKAVLLKEAASSGMDTKGLSDVEIIKAYLDRKALEVRVSDEEAKAFYDNNRVMVGNAPFDQMKEPIQKWLLGKKRQETVDSYQRGLGAKRNIQVNMEWMKSQVALAKDNPVEKARTSGKPTMVEFGATGCVACELMEIVLENLRRDYSPDTLNIVFVHVVENPILGGRFGIRDIPVQVFYDKDGKEFFRHFGSFEYAEVVKKLQQMGVK